MRIDPFRPSVDVPRELIFNSEAIENAGLDPIEQVGQILKNPPQKQILGSKKYPKNASRVVSVFSNVRPFL